MAALGMTLTWPASAQTSATSASPNPLAHAERAANLFGREIVGSDNQKIGKVDNVVVDLESEHILYVVVDDSGRGKVAVVPQIFGASSGKTVQSSVTKQKSVGAPQFTDSGNTSEQLGQASFVANVYRYFGVNPWWQGSAPVNQGSFHNVHKLNQLIGMTVEDINNQNIGKISNVVVDMPSGRVLYAVFSPASSLNLGDNLYAMPSDAFTAPVHSAGDRCRSAKAGRSSSFPEKPVAESERPDFRVAGLPVLRQTSVV
jgi:sporulation protein YlmC with PRC-barrel domain